ncbi:MAG: hypothetical protein ACOC8F_02665 [Planctomycetota bacterium]
MARKKSQTSSGKGRFARLGEALAARGGAIGRGTLAAACVLVPLIGGALGLSSARRYVVEHRARGHVRPRVRLVDAPSWLPPTLRRRIVADVSPPTGADLRDPQLAERVYRRAGANPWLSDVRRVRKCRTDDPSRGVVEVSATYRAPAARVLSDDGRRFAYVSRDAHRLPDTVPLWRARVPVDGGTRTAYFTGRAHIPAGATDAARVHYFALRGIEATPPAPGEPWTGEDVEAGLRIVELLRDRPYRAQIAEIDVRNVRWRVTRSEPQIRLLARDRWGRRTEIVFGRFPHPDGDWVVTPHEKMTKLDAYAGRHGGRVVGFHARVDLTRPDQVAVMPYDEGDARRRAARGRDARPRLSRYQP